MLSSSMNLATTVIGFGMSITFIVFICARLIYACIGSAHSHAAAFHFDVRSNLDSQEHTIGGGLEPFAVAAIPTIKFNSNTFYSKEDAQCSICLGEYQEKDTLRIMPTCCHNFHLACIDVWLQKQSTCPICRLPLIDPFKPKHADTTTGILQPMRSRAIQYDHSDQWLLPGSSRLRVDETNQEIHESLSLMLEAPVEERETRR